jgi:uncharacterized protein (TIGR03083 family)
VQQGLAIEQRIGNAASSVAWMLREAADVHVRVHGGEWSVADGGAHLVCVLDCFTDSLSGNGSRWSRLVPDDPDYRQRLAAANAAMMRDVDRDPERLAALLVERADAFLSASSRVQCDLECDTPWYGPGVTRSVETLRALALGELTIHGYDIARALGQSSSLDADTARLVIETAFTAMAPLLVDRGAAAGLEANFDVRVRGAEPFLVAVHGGDVAVSSTSGGARVDCHLSAEPVALMLVGYGRISHWSALARFRLIAWGRRPWLALRFPRLFVSP